MMDSNKKLENGEKKSQVNQLLEKNGSKNLNRMIIIGKENLIDILYILNNKSMRLMIKFLKKY